jgi:phosphoglycerate kinase
MAAFRTLDDADVKGKRVLVRIDLNLPMADGKVTDDTRVRAAEPTIKEIADKGGRVILLAHFGRPKGGPEAKYSLKQVVPAVVAVIGKPVAFAEDCVGQTAEKAVAVMKDGNVLLLENTRFHAGEEKNDPAFIDALARLGDLYVNDAFSAAHRAHASTEGIARKLPAYAGRSMQAELQALDAALGNPKRPVVAIVGGAKVSSKIDLLENLVKKVDALIIGGGMANTFLLAKGINVGKSLAEPDLADTARRILAAAERAGSTIVLPDDVVVAPEFKAGAPATTVAQDKVPADQMVLDVGPKSIAAVNSWIDKAATLVWNGPLGAFEIPPFDKATVAAARQAAERTKAGNLLSVAGGGDTVAALNHAGAAEGFSFISTAGGAFLEWMEGKPLPGVEALRAT